MSKPSEQDFSKYVLEVASLDFFRPKRDRSPVDAARFGEETLRCDDLLRFDTSNIDAEMLEDTWLVSLAMVSGLSWLMSRTSERKCPTS